MRHQSLVSNHRCVLSDARWINDDTTEKVTFVSSKNAVSQAGNASSGFHAEK